MLREDPEGEKESDPGRAPMGKRTRLGGNWIISQSMRDKQT